MIPCQNCGSSDVEYLGVNDGGGDYGTALCDEYKCNACQKVFEVDCVEYGHEEDEETEQ